MDKVLFTFGTYGSNNHPCIWFKVKNSQHCNYILTYDDKDALNTLQKEILNFLELEYTIEFVTLENFFKKNKGYKNEKNNRT